MTEPTLADLAARMTVVEARLGITAPVDPAPTPDPTPTPTPDPTPPAAPAKPTGLACVIAAAGRPQLTWDVGQGATAWEVYDLLGGKTPVATVTEPRSTRSALKAGQHRRYALLAVGPGGRSAMSDPIDVPPAGGGGSPTTPTPAPSTGAVRYPADITGKGWYLTLPTGTQGSPDTVKMPALATYSSKYLELTPAGDGAVFRAWHGGVTTSGSPNPRSELRECNPDGSLAKWSALKGRHSMEVVGQVNRLTKVRPHCVIAQIHGASDDVCVFRVEGSNLWITDGNNNHGHLVTDAFKLGERYTLRFDVAPNPDGKTGRVTFHYNGVEVPFAVTTSDVGNYFKAGAYLQSNPTSAAGESTAEFCEVVVYSVNVTHAA